METVRDKTIELITSNLLMANVISVKEVAKSMMILNDLDDITLALTLLESKLALNHYYERLVEACKDVYKPEEAEGLSL